MSILPLFSVPRAMARLFVFCSVLFLCQANLHKHLPWKLAEQKKQPKNYGIEASVKEVDKYPLTFLVTLTNTNDFPIVIAESQGPFSIDPDPYNFLEFYNEKDDLPLYDFTRPDYNPPHHGRIAYSGAVELGPGEIKHGEVDIGLDDYAVYDQFSTVGVYELIGNGSVKVKGRFDYIWLNTTLKDVNEHWYDDMAKAAITDATYESDRIAT